jgi:hypothetical protein
MFRFNFRKLKRRAKSALAAMLRGSGTGALYLATSTLLAALLLGTYLTYAWDIDKEKWYKAFAALRGDDISEMRQAARDRIAGLSHDDILEHRAMRLLKEDFDRDVRRPTESLPLPPEDPKPDPPPPAPSETERLNAYDKRVEDDLAKYRTAGHDEMTRLIEDQSMDVDQAKEIIRKFWKDGFKDLVLVTLLDMADKRRGDILNAFQTSTPDELKDLNEILKDINDGKPMTDIIKKAANEP